MVIRNSDLLEDPGIDVSTTLLLGLHLARSANPLIKVHGCLCYSLVHPSTVDHVRENGPQACTHEAPVRRCPYSYFRYTFSKLSQLRRRRLWRRIAPGNSSPTSDLAGCLLAEGLRPNLRYPVQVADMLPKVYLLSH